MHRYIQAPITRRIKFIEGIALRRSNQYNGYYFMNLQTGKRISSNKWEVLPTPERVVKRVHELAENEQRPPMMDKTMVFEYEPGTPVFNNEGEDDNQIYDNTNGENDENLDLIEEVEGRE